MGGGVRSRFKEGSAPVPPPPAFGDSSGRSTQPAHGLSLNADSAPSLAARATPPPIPLKFYGFTTPRNGAAKSGILPWMATIFTKSPVKRPDQESLNRVPHRSHSAVVEDTTDNISRLAAD